ncbi:hypothetical protein DFP73DRAFT_621289 [Morchella snyderi]|nr:hypothetical protein DFP73DRAFT_621289 [Morchella snyderi]
MSEKGLLGTIALQQKIVEDLTNQYHHRHARSTDLKKKCDVWRHKRNVSESGPRAYWNKDLEEESKLKAELAALLEKKRVEEVNLKALLGIIKGRMAKEEEDEWEDEDVEDKNAGEGDEEEDREELREGEAVVGKTEKEEMIVEWRGTPRAGGTENDVRMLEQRWTKQTDDWRDGNSWDEQVEDVETDRLAMRLWIPLRLASGTALWN